MDAKTPMFPSAFDVKAPKGAEGWESLYPYYTQFQPSRRAEDDAATINRRLHTALTEIRHWTDYDYVLVNDDLDRCFVELQSILAAERLKRTRHAALGGLISTLDRDLEALLSAQAKAL